MADNTQLNAGTGGDLVRSKDKGGVKTGVVVVDVGGSGTEALLSSANPMPIVVQGNAANAPLYVAPGTGAEFDVTPAAPVATSYLPVRLTDGTSFYTATSGSGGSGGQQYAEDAAHASGDLGNVALAVRKDTATQLAGTDGDYSVLLTDASGRLHVNVGNAVAVTGTFFQATQPVSLASLPALAAGSAAIGSITNTGFIANAGTNLNTSALALEAGGNLAAINTKLVAGHGTAAAAIRVELPTDGTGVVLANMRDAAGNALTSLSVGGQRAITVAVVDGTGTQVTSFGGGGGGGALTAGTTGGWTPTHMLTAATNNATSLKSSAGQVGGYVLTNTNPAARYVKFYDKATAPTPASDTPKLVVAVAGGSASAPTVVTLNNAAGLSFALGIGLAVVANMSNTDNTAVSANDMSVGVFIK